MKRVYLSGMGIIIIVGLALIITTIKKPRMIFAKPQVAPQDVTERPRTAEEYFRSSCDLYKEALEKIGRSPEGYDEMSPEEKKEYYYKKVVPLMDAAIESYQEVIDKCPESKWADDAQLCIGLSYALQSTGKEDKAIEAFQKVITDYPEARLEEWTRKNMECIIAAREGINLHAGAQVEIAMAYRRKKDYSRAIAEHNKVIDNYPQDRMAGLAAYGIKSCSSKINDYKPAIEALQKLLKTRTNTPKEIAFYKKKIEELKAKQKALKSK